MMVDSAIYLALTAGLARKKIKKRQVQELLGISAKSLYNKLKGKTPFLLEEAFLIRNTLFPELALDDLFSKSK